MSTGKRKRQPEYRNGDKWAKAKTNVPPSYVSAIQRAEEWVSENIELKPSFFVLARRRSKFRQWYVSLRAFVRSLSHSFTRSLNGLSFTTYHDFVVFHISHLPVSIFCILFTKYKADDDIQGGAGKYKQCVIQFLCQLYKSSCLEQAFFKKKDQHPALEGLDPKALVLPIVDAANEAIL
eukprot:scaffold84877_cov56-Attheya_sp.AAC.3